MGPGNNLSYRKCSTEEETSVHILCECEAYLRSFFLDPKDITKLHGGPFGTLAKEQGSYYLVQNMGHKRPVLRPRCIGAGRAQTHILLFYSTWPEQDVYVLNTARRPSP